MTGASAPRWSGSSSARFPEGDLGQEELERANRPVGRGCGPQAWGCPLPRPCPSSAQRRSGQCAPGHSRAVTFWGDRPSPGPPDASLKSAPLVTGAEISWGAGRAAAHSALLQVTSYDTERRWRMFRGGGRVPTPSGLASVSGRWTVAGGRRRPFLSSLSCHPATPRRRGDLLTQNPGIQDSVPWVAGLWSANPNSN